MKLYLVKKRKKEAKAPGCGLPLNPEDLSAKENLRRYGTP